MAQNKAGKKVTTIGLTADELADLGRLIGAGKVMLQHTYPVVGRIKRAMTAIGVSTKGL